MFRNIFKNLDGDVKLVEYKQIVLISVKNSENCNSFLFREPCFVGISVYLITLNAYYSC